MSQNSMVCIIDDDKIYQSLTKRMVHKLVGTIDITQFLDGTDAYEYFKRKIEAGEKLPKIVLLDINMPTMDGWEFLAKIEKLSIDFTEIDIHIVSSSIAIQDMEKAKGNGNILGYITKPIKPETLKKLMEPIA